MARTLGDGKQLLSSLARSGRKVVWSAICGVLVGCGLPWPPKRRETCGFGELYSGSSGFRWSGRSVPVPRGEHCQACRGSGNAVMAPDAYSRAEHLGERAASITERKVLRDPKRSGLRCVHWSKSSFDGFVYGSRLSQGNQGLRGSRIGGNRISSGNAGDGASTEAGEVGHLLSVRR